MDILFKELSYKTVGAAMEVHRWLGPGSLEAVYGRALAYELELCAIALQCEALIPVQYKGRPMGDYKADFIVERKIILKLKALSTLTAAQQAQVHNYLAGTGLSLAILINFGTPSLSYKRIVVTNRHKLERISTGLA